MGLRNFCWKLRAVDAVEAGADESAPIGRLGDHWLMAEKSKKNRKNGPIARASAWNKAFHKRMRMRFGLSKYQYLTVTFVKGLVVGFALALLFQTFVGPTSTERKRQPCGRSSTALFLLRATTSSTWMATPTSLGRQ